MMSDTWKRMLAMAWLVLIVAWLNIGAFLLVIGVSIHEGGIAGYMFWLLEVCFLTTWSVQAVR